MTQKSTFLLLCFIFTFSFLSAADITKAEIIGKENQFYFDFDSLSVVFLSDTEYTFRGVPGGYLWNNYTYTLENNILTLEFCTEWIGNDQFDQRQLIFPDGKDAVFTWNGDYIDFYCKGAFFGEKATLRNFKIPTPAGTKCMLNGIPVIKQTGNEKVVAQENLKLRETPSLEAATGTIYYWSARIADGFQDYTSKYNKAPWQGYFLNEKDLSVLLAGYTLTYDAITAFEDEIDGYSAPWYRIVFPGLEEDKTEYYWVYGGYLEQADSAKSEEYVSLFRENAIAKGLLEQ